MTGFNIGVFDLETTGVDTEEARIVSAYLGLLAPDGSVLMEQEFLVRPDGFEIPEGATKVHGITTEYALEHGAPLSTVLEQIGSIIMSMRANVHPLGGHNISYDLTVLDREGNRVWPGSRVSDLIGDMAVLDSYVLDKHLVKWRKGSGKRQLVPLAEAWGVHLTEEEAHGARADAIAAGRIIQVQLGQPKIRGWNVRRLHDAQIGWKAEQSADLEAWFRSPKAGARQDPTAVVSRDWPFIPRQQAA